MSVDSIPIEFFDERFTSQQADAMGGSVSRDEKSAMAILEGYLEFLKNKK
jgi:RNase H-fold protein (predicted Holliday junction resolvase)